MRPSSNPPPRLPADPAPYHGNVEQPRGAHSWAVWVGLTLLAAIVASCSDRVVDRVFTMIDDDRAPEVVFVPVPSGASVASIESASRRDDGTRNPAPAISTAAPVRAAPPSADPVAIAPLPAGPEGEAGLVAAVRAGTLRPAGPSDLDSGWRGTRRREAPWTVTHCSHRCALPMWCWTTSRFPAVCTVRIRLRSSCRPAFRIRWETRATPSCSMSLRAHAWVLSAPAWDADAITWGTGAASRGQSVVALGVEAVGRVLVPSGSRCQGC